MSNRLLLPLALAAALLLPRVAVTSDSAAQQQTASTSLAWQPPGTLSADDRAIIDGISQRIRSALKGTPFSSSFSTPDRVALLPTPQGNFLFVRYPSTGNCADFQFFIFAPRDNSGHRKLMFGGDVCVEEINIHPTGGPVPDLVIPSKTTDGILHWRGNHWDDPTPILLKDEAATHPH